MKFAIQYLNEMKEILEKIDKDSIEKMVELLAMVRQSNGRLFLLGVGGSAATASHAVNDFRKIAGFEVYSPVDNVSELTARTNDEGWESVFQAWLEGSRLNKYDALVIFSVGGGNVEKKVSVNIVNAIKYAKLVGAKVTGVVGRDGGYTATHADACVLIPTVNPDHITPHTESFHSVITHLLVSHPSLKAKPTKWESTK